MSRSPDLAAYLLDKQVALNAQGAAIGAVVLRAKDILTSAPLSTFAADTTSGQQFGWLAPTVPSRRTRNELLLSRKTFPSRVGPAKSELPPRWSKKNLVHYSACDEPVPPQKVRRYDALDVFRDGSVGLVRYKLRKPPGRRASYRVLCLDPDEMR